MKCRIESLKKAGVGVVLSLMLFGCAVDQDKEANRLYVEASQFMQDMKGESESYSTAFEFYKNAKVNVDRVLSECPSSDLAVALLSEGTKIAGFSLTEFRDLEGDLESLSVAEQNILSCAVLVAEKIEDEFDKLYVLQLLVDAQAKAGFFHRALDLSLTIENDFYKKLAIKSVSREYAMAGLFDQAFETLGMLNVADRELALKRISVTCAMKGEFPLALEKVERIEDGALKTQALVDIAGIYAKEGKNEEAAHVLSLAKEKVETIEPDYTRISNLNEILEKHPELGKKVIKLLAQEFEPSVLKISGFIKIAEMYAEIGSQEEATKLLGQALDVAKTIRPKFLKVSCFIKIAEASVEVGLSERSPRLLTRAFELASTIQDEDSRASALVEVAGARGITGNAEQRTELLFQIVREIGAVGEVSDLIGVAKKFSEGGANDAATKLLSQVLEMLKTGWWFEPEKIEVLEEITAVYADMGKLIKALEVANMITDVSSQGKAISRIANKYAEKGELIRAIEINMVAENISLLFQQDAFWHFENGDFDRAVKKAKTIKDEALGIRTLVEISDRCVDEGEADRAKMLLSQAFEITQGLKNGYSKVELLLLIADKHAMAGRDELKFRLWFRAFGAIKAVDSRYLKACFLTEIAHRYTSAEKEIDQKDRGVLSEIVQMECPMDLGEDSLFFK